MESRVARVLPGHHPRTRRAAALSGTARRVAAASVFLQRDGGREVGTGNIPAGPFGRAHRPRPHASPPALAVRSPPLYAVRSRARVPATHRTDRPSGRARYCCVMFHLSCRNRQHLGAPLRDNVSGPGFGPVRCRHDAERGARRKDGGRRATSSSPSANRM